MSKMYVVKAKALNPATGLREQCYLANAPADDGGVNFVTEQYAAMRFTPRLKREIEAEMLTVGMDSDVRFVRLVSKAEKLRRRCVDRIVQATLSEPPDDDAFVFIPVRSNPSINCSMLANDVLDVLASI